MSLTLTLSQPSNILSADFFPPIILEENVKYEIGLLSFDSYNTIPNIDDSNNKIHINSGDVITIPSGNYEINDIAVYVEKKFSEFGETFILQANNNTLTLSVKSSVDIDFTSKDSIGSLLGFNKRVLKKGITHAADRMVDIMRVHTIDITSNISRGAYVNGRPSHSLHMFSPKAGPGFKIREKPNDVIYLPIDGTIIENITLKIYDQDGNLVNFRGELITIRLHLRKA